MVADLRIDNVEQFKILSRALRHGSKELRSELTKGITRVTKPLKADAKASAKSVLPSRGGLGARVAKTSMPTTKRTSGRWSGVRIVAKPSAVNDPGRINRGRIKHPVWGRGPWVLQDVTPGWFTDPMVEGAPKVREELVEVMEQIAVKIVRTL